MAAGAWLPVAGVTGLWRVDTSLDGVGVRRWEVLADAGVRARLRGPARATPVVEVGATAAVVTARALDLAIARSRTSVAFGPRLAAGVLLGAGRVAPFVLLAAQWFPAPPSVSALPNGSLGHTPSFTISLTAGASWGWL